MFISGAQPFFGRAIAEGWLISDLGAVERDAFGALFYN